MNFDFRTFSYTELDLEYLKKVVVFSQQTFSLNREEAEAFAKAVTKEVSKLLRDIPRFSKPPDRVFGPELFFGHVALSSSILSSAIYLAGLRSEENIEDEDVDLSKNSTVKDALFFISCIILAIRIYKSIVEKKFYALQGNIDNIKGRIKDYLLPYFQYSIDVAARWILNAAQEMRNILIDEELRWMLVLNNDEEEIAAILFDLYIKEPNKYEKFKRIDKENYYQMARGLVRGLSIYTMKK